MQPDATTRYFDTHCPEYSTGRLAHAAAWLAEHVGPEASLVDVGCGAGNALEYLRERTGIRDTVGIDTSRTLLDRTASRLGCPVHQASVLDDDLVERVGRRFDVVLLASVLHHLVGGSRSRSKRLARQALTAAVDLTRPGGVLIVFEPVLEPAAAMWLLFQVKQLVSSIVPRRVELLGRWNNVGAPVVSYLTPRQLLRMAEDAGAIPVARQVTERRVGVLWRLGGIRRRCDVTLVLKRQAAPR